MYGGCLLCPLYPLLPKTVFDPSAGIEPIQGGFASVYPEFRRSSITGNQGFDCKKPNWNALLTDIKSCDLKQTRLPSVTHWQMFISTRFSLLCWNFWSTFLRNAMSKFIAKSISWSPKRLQKQSKQRAEFAAWWRHCGNQPTYITYITLILYWAPPPLSNKPPPSNKLPSFISWEES